MQDELTALQPELVKAGKETDAAMVVIAAETVEADKVKVLVAKDEASASEEAARVKAIKDECEADLARAMPLLNKAIAALDTLSAGDISQVKGFSSPPAPVKLVMEAVCICKGVKPTRVQQPDGKMGDDYWDAAKKMLMDPKFLESLKKYDKDNINPKIIKRIREQYVPMEEFQPDKIAKSLESGVRFVFLGPGDGGVRPGGERYVLHFPNPGRLFAHTILTLFWQNSKSGGAEKTATRGGGTRPRDRDGGFERKAGRAAAGGG